MDYASCIGWQPGRVFASQSQRRRIYHRPNHFCQIPTDWGGIRERAGPIKNKDTVADSKTALPPPASHFRSHGGLHPHSINIPGGCQPCASIPTHCDKQWPLCHHCQKFEYRRTCSRQRSIQVDKGRIVVSSALPNAPPVATHTTCAATQHLERRIKHANRLAAQKTFVW